jgi:hypothetical protein
MKGEEQAGRALGGIPPSRVASVSPRGWTGALTLSAVLPSLAAVPLLGVPLLDDDRFDLYRWGAEYAGRPTGIFVDQIQLIRFHIAHHGNFRPIGRMLERGQDTIVYLVSEGLALPANLVLRGWFMLSVGLLGIAICLFVGTITSKQPTLRGAPSRPVILAGSSLAPLIVASGRDAPVVMFTDIYLQSVALGLLVAAGACRLDYFRSRPLRWIELVVAAVTGVAVAAFSELAAITAPLAVIAVFARGMWTLGISWRALVRLPVTGILTSGLAGFFGLFVPIRLVIFTRCREVACYAPSELHVSSDSLGLLVERTASWMPPLAWPVAADGWGVQAYLPSHPVQVLLATTVGLTSLLVLRRLHAVEEVDPRPLFAAGGALILLGGALGASNAYLQYRALPIGAGWRDSSLTVVGGTLLVVAIIETALRARPEAAGVTLRFVTASLALMLIMTINVNSAWATSVREQDESRTLNAISLSLAHFDSSDRGNEDRCRLLRRFLAPYAVGEYAERRMEAALDVTAKRLGAAPYCWTP